MNFLTGSVYNPELVRKHIGKAFRIKVIKVPGKPLGIGSLRIVTIREENSEIELILAYEDYIKWQKQDHSRI